MSENLPDQVPIETNLLEPSSAGINGPRLIQEQRETKLVSAAVKSIETTTQIDVQQNVVISSHLTLNTVEAEIEHIRDLATKIVPADEAINNLRRLRQFANYKKASRGFSLRRLWRFRSYEPYTTPFTKRLAEIETKIKADSSEAHLRATLHELRTLMDDIQIKIRQLSSTFVGLTYSATTSKELIEDLILKIGHRELRDEARMHLGIVIQLVSRLNLDELIGADIRVLDHQILGSIGIMIELEQRKLAVEELVHRDQRRRQWTVGFVIFYIALVLALTVFLGFRWRDRFLMGDRQLTDFRLPLIGIPWPVIVWSLIGSFAAMIYRFNKKPIYDFGDAVKWMLTRPVQGAVLGSAFYLVLISGLFLFGARSTAENSATGTANAVILILSFLVGFSDRFADSVFRSIVDKYSQPTESKKNKTAMDSEAMPAKKS